MTTRWKRLTALMLILLTLLNAGSALAAEEFWKRMLRVTSIGLPADEAVLVAQSVKKIFAE